MRKLLFELAAWHGLAKLRLHTETIVRDLETSTTRLGDLLHVFQIEMCPQYQMFDLLAEEAARARRKAAAMKKNNMASSASAKADMRHKGKGSGSRQPQKFNLNTYKIHSLGGYAKVIWLYGSPDNYNSQVVSTIDDYVQWLTKLPQCLYVLQRIEYCDSINKYFPKLFFVS